MKTFRCMPVILRHGEPTHWNTEAAEDGGEAAPVVPEHFYGTEEECNQARRLLEVIEKRES